MKYINELIYRYKELDSCKDKIICAVNSIIFAIKNNGKIMVCGNGGSAADAEHIVGELMKGFLNKRELKENEKEKFRQSFPEEGDIISANLQRAIPAIALTGHPGLATAYANDVNSDYVFAQQVYGLGNKNDVLICLSTSGNSKNVVNAAKVAVSKDIFVISLTGEGGGKLDGLSNITIAVPERETYKVQELHLPIYHAICAQIEEILFVSDDDAISPVEIGEVKKLYMPTVK